MKTIMKLSLLVACVLSVGCISSAPIVPVTPDNQSQVTTCQGIATLHNGVVIGDFVLGGATSGLAAVGAVVSDSNTKNDLAITAAVIAGLGVAGTAIAAYSAQNFTDSNCSSVVGNLPSSASTKKVKTP